MGHRSTNLNYFSGFISRLGINITSCHVYSKCMHKKKGNIIKLNANRVIIRCGSFQIVEITNDEADEICTHLDRAIKLCLLQGGILSPWCYFLNENETFVLLLESFLLFECIILNGIHLKLMVQLSHANINKDKLRMCS